MRGRQAWVRNSRRAETASSQRFHNQMVGPYCSRGNWIPLLVADAFETARGAEWMPRLRADRERVCC